MKTRQKQIRQSREKKPDLLQDQKIDALNDMTIEDMERFRLLMKVLCV